MSTERKAENTTINTEGQPKANDGKDPVSEATDVPTNVPVAFLLLEKTELTTETGCLSTFSLLEDRNTSIILG